MTIVGEACGKRGAVIERKEGTVFTIVDTAFENLMFLPKV